MAEQSAQAKPARTRSDGAIVDVAFNGITPATKTIEDFAHAVAQMSRQALERTTQHLEELRQAHSAEEVASIQTDFVKESLEHAVQYKNVHPNADDLAARAGATGKRGGTGGRGRQARRCGEDRAPFRSCL
jgi:hypothetical protein